MTLRAAVVLGSVVAMLALSAEGARGAEGTDAKAPDVATVLRDLHAANQTEIAAGRLAKERGQTVEVQVFGSTLIADHTTADQRVVALAAAKKIELPAEIPMPPDEKRDMRALASAQGAAFDELFATRMLADHQKILAEARAARAETSDARLKTLLEVTIPVLEAHLQTSRALVDNLVPNAEAAAQRRRR